MSSKENIYRAAAILFEKKGFRASTIRDIAQVVQLEPSSLYSHIRSKDEILEKICKDISIKYEEALDEILISSDPLLKKIEQIIFYHIEFALNDPCSITVFNDEWKHLQEPYLSDFVNHRRAYQGQLESLISSAQQMNLIHDSDISIIVNTLISSLQWVHKISNIKQVESKDVLKKKIADLLLQGMAI